MKISAGAAGIMSIALLGAPVAMFATGCAANQVAATVNGENIDESTITEYIQNFRKTNNLEDDATWAQWMVDNGRDAESVRSDAIDYYVQLALIDQNAKEKGITVTDEEVNAQFDEIKDYYGFDEEEFKQQLTDLGYTEQTYKDYLRQSLTQEQLMEAVAPQEDPTDEDVLSTANSYTTILDGAKKITTIVVEDETVANDLRAQAVSGADFAALASENSVTTDYSGWDVLMGIDQTIYQALENANKGDITPVTPSDDGTRYFIIKVDDVLHVDVENGFASIDQVPVELYEEFKSTVKQSSSTTEFDSYLQELKDTAEITINPMPANLPYDVSTEGLESSTGITTDDYAVDENGEAVADDYEVTPVDEGEGVTVIPADGEEDIDVTEEITE